MQQSINEAFQTGQIIVFKDMSELPAYLKHITEYIPEPREQVKVVETSELVAGGRDFVKVRFGKPFKYATLGTNYFRTIRRDQMRQTLLSKPRTPAIEAALKKI